MNLSIAGDRPDEAAPLQAFGEEAQSVAVSPQHFYLVTPASAEDEPRQPGGCKLKTGPVRPVVAARPADYVCSEDPFY
ncbi:Uncharacterised protein [Escherichia coli]|nr:Uncharacterised protein [Escherichia coli]SQM27333.1 Uncharacterised protein [Escherichia coli]